MNRCLLIPYLLLSLSFATAAMEDEAVPSLRHKETTGAFMVTSTLSATNMTYLQTLIFDTIVYDAGNHYSTTSGKFRCPNSGVYTFHATVRSGDPAVNEWYFQLVKDEQPIMNVTAWKPYVGKDNSGSNLCIVHCTASESVWLRVSYPQSGVVSIYSNHYCSFGGFLIHDDAVEKSDPLHTHSVGAFSATLHNPVYGLAHNDTLIYENIWYDEWNVYDVNTGQYTCPFSGNYAFYVTISTYDQLYGPVDMVLARNGGTIMRITARNPDAGHKLGNNACVVFCNAGDIITVRADYPGNFVAVWGENLSSFSAIFINEQVSTGRHDTAGIGVFYVSRQQDVTLALNDTLVFDTNIYNPDFDYDTTYGFYRCPVNGVYVMFATITSAPGVDARFHLAKDSTDVYPRLFLGHGRNDTMSGSAMWIMQCSTGSEITLHMTVGSSITIKGNMLTTFSGFLLVPTK